MRSQRGVTETGASVIIVDNGIDSGPVIAQERVPVLPGDTEASLHERIKPVERRLLERVILDIANGTISLKELARDERTRHRSLASTASATPSRSAARSSR